MKNNQIFKIHGTDYREMTIRLLREADLNGHIPHKKCRIGIKPNLVSPSEASWGATTHPQVVEGIIDYLYGNGYTDIKILEGSWVGDKTTEAFSLCGYDELSRRKNVPLIDLQKDGSHLVDAAGMELRICNMVSGVDFLINVPVLKGHCQTKVTCALKNCKGLIPNSEKRRFHSMGLHKPIAHLNTVIRPDFIVVDHICGDLDFEDGGNPVIRNIIMAALDPVLTDSYACYLMHYSADDVPYIRMAEKLGVGCADLEQADIRMCGGQEDPEEDLPSSRKILEVQDTVEEVESCSACYGYLIPALDRLREEGLLDALRRKLGTQRIRIGQGFRGKKGCLGIGNCTSNFTYFVKGCPPVEEDIYQGLLSWILREEK